MKKILLLCACLSLLFGAQKLMAEGKKMLPDGVYLIKKSGNDKVPVDKPETGEKRVKFNSKFLKNSPQIFDQYIVDEIEYVPLILKKNPEYLKNDDKRIILTLDDTGAVQFYNFTTDNISKSFVLIIRNEVVYMEKIKFSKESGAIQIPNCTEDEYGWIIKALKTVY